MFEVRVPGYRHRLFLRAGTSDLNVLSQIILKGEADFALNRPAEFVIDAGADIGLTSVVFARRYRASRIVALEVNEINYALLRRNVQHYPNVTPLRAALWSHAEFVRIKNPDAEAWAFQVERTSADNPGDIPTTTLWQLVEKFGVPEISLLKLDIEGSEREVLAEGDTDWLEHTKTLAVELHDRFKPGCAEALSKILSGRPHRRITQGEYEVVYLG